jgi:hypothetical protein
MASPEPLEKYLGFFEWTFKAEPLAAGTLNNKHINADKITVPIILNLILYLSLCPGPL